MKRLGIKFGSAPAAGVWSQAIPARFSGCLKGVLQEVLPQNAGKVKALPACGSAYSGKVQIFRIRSPRPMPAAPVRMVSKIRLLGSASKKLSSLSEVPVTSTV